MIASIPHIKTPSPKFTSEELNEIKAAQAEAAAIQERMDQLHDRRAVKQVLAESSNAFASGELDLQSAVLSSLVGLTATDSVLTELRGACKLRLKALFLGVQPLIVAGDRHRIEELKIAAAELELAEREASRNLGIGNDDFQPSPRLEQLRETHRRALENFELGNRRAPNAADFARLITAIG